MKYVTAIFASLLIFIMVFLLSGLLLAFILPVKWSSIAIQIGPFEASISSFISLIIAVISGRHTFKASLIAKTGKLYRKQDNDSEQDKRCE